MKVIHGNPLKMLQKFQQRLVRISSTGINIGNTIIKPW